jgi:hypothetical protein
MMNHDMESIKKDFLIFCDQDWAGLWVLISFIQDANPNMREDKIREMTLGILRDLLDEGLILAGAPAEHTKFNPWKSGTEETLRRIRDEWIKLGGCPALGDIVWLDITQKGVDLVASWEKKT